MGCRRIKDVAFVIDVFSSTFCCFFLLREIDSLCYPFLCASLFDWKVTLHNQIGDVIYRTTSIFFLKECNCNISFETQYQRLRRVCNNTSIVVFNSLSFWGLWHRSLLLNMAELESLDLRVLFYYGPVQACYSTWRDVLSEEIMCKRNKEIRLHLCLDRN